MHEKGFYKKLGDESGYGGRSCGCCFPQDPNGKKAVKRLEVRTQRKLFSKLLKEELKEYMNVADLV